MDDLVVILLIFTCNAPASANKRTEIKFAPKFTSQPRPEYVLKTGESVEVLCRVDEAFSPAIYYWKKNDVLLPINGVEIKQVPGEGTLVIKNPQPHHSGIYQCFAKNDYGVAVSTKSVLRKAELESFPTLHKGPELHRPTEGEPLILRCNPPKSYPIAAVYWGENKNQSKLMPLPNDDRVSLDFKGNLYFAHVEMKDDRGGLWYVCVAHNTAVRIMVQGDDQKIVPIPHGGMLEVSHPKLMWSSRVNDVAIKGTTKRMKCIFSGYPTPKVTWVRLEGPMPASAVLDSFGQELQITNVTYNDGGKYQCNAVVIEGAVPVTVEFFLDIESPPYWRNNKPPEDVNTSDEEDASFHCLSDGTPKPSVNWMIDGEPIDDLPKDPRRILMGSTLRFLNVSKSDAKVVQCNVSNPHGYIFANAYLKIIAEPPSYLEPLANVTKVAEGHGALLSCKAFGAPKPELIWQKGSKWEDVLDFDDDRIEVFDNGDLSIKNAQKSDEDHYHCYLHNKFGTNSSSGLLIITEQTVIKKKPQNQVVNATSNVTFNCEAVTDSNEMKNLKIEWGQYGNIITSGSDPRYALLDDNRTFLIKNSTVLDSGKLKCIASNGIDSDEAAAELIVKDIPDPPYSVRIVNCDGGTAEVMWEPGSNNNDPIIHFIVYYNTSIDDPGKYHEACNLKTSLNRCIVELRPWANFTFHVVAGNSIGLSQKSEFTTQPCTTKPEPPSRHPNLVCTESRTPNSLVIVWEPMLRTEHNAEGFHYLVSYRRKDEDFDNDEDANRKVEFNKEKVTDWRQSELVIHKQPVFEEYVISVEAVNVLGSSPGFPNKIIGFSSEHTPIESPTGFGILNETLNSTSVVFVWNEVDTSRDKIRGFFTGYQVRFWRTENPSVVRTRDVILHEWKQCHPYPEEMRFGRSLPENTHEVLTNDLWSFSSITAGVVVLNGAKSSQISDTISFETPEGVPGMVPMFWVSERGSHHLKLSWEAPYEVNGILKGYIIKYREEEGANPLEWYDTVVTDPKQLYKKLHDLRSSTTYRISIWALTRAGESSEVNTISEPTVSEQSPDRPIISTVESGFDYVNVSWSSGKNPRNPGREYVVEYRKIDDIVWLETAIETEHNWVNISELEHGVSYLFRVAAFNKKGDSMKSDPVEHIIGIKPVATSSDSVHRGSAALFWILLILSIILLTFFIFLLIFLLRHNRGGSYPVHEKEMLHGFKFDEEATFDEYIRSENSTFKSRQGSLESSHKSSDEEEGSDSLGAYEDVDPTKFNDDGSFVDQVTLNSKPTHEYQKL